MSDLFKDQIPLMKPFLWNEERNAVADVIRSGWITQGEKVAEFERRVAAFVGKEYAIAVNSGTSALQLALELQGIGPGDDVICPAYTCMATANAIHRTGAMPVFCDVDPDTYNIDPGSAEAVITERTRAIMVVHQHGLAADLTPIRYIAETYYLQIVEDAACALGAEYLGNKVGSCYSFHPRKMITTGEGGMIVTDDERLANDARQLRSNGASIDDLTRHRAVGGLQHEYTAVGMNFRMTDMQAAMGIVQLGRLPYFIKERWLCAHDYRWLLEEIEWIKNPDFDPSFL